MFENIAYAAGTQGAGAPEANPLALFFPFFLVFGIMYFLVWRPQQKQRKELDKLIEGLKKGDRVVTAGGIIGTVTSVQKDYVVMKVGDNDSTKMEVLKTAVSGIRN